MNGHYGEDLWGLATHPTRLEFITSGAENRIYLWDMESHKLTKQYHAEYPLTFVNYAPNGKRIAAATKYGIVYIFNDKLQIEKELDEEADPDKDIIGNLKFSPNSDVLAVTYNFPYNNIILYDA